MGGAAGVAGTIIGSMMSPTTLIPISKAYQGYKGLAAVGALYGAEYNILEQLAKTGRVDPSQLAGATALGAVAAPATSAVIKTLTPSARKALIQRNSPEEKLKAQNDFEEIQDIVFESRANGMNDAEIKIQIQNKMGLSQDEIDSILIKADGKFKIPSIEEAQAVIAAKIKNISPVAATSGWKFGEDFLGVIDTAVKAISPKVHGKLAKTEYEIAQQTHDYTEIAKPLTDILDKIKGEDLKVVSRSLFNGEFDDAVKVMNRYDANSKQALQETRDLLKNIHERLTKEAGYENLGDIDNYFPRMVKSYDDFLKNIGKENQTKIQKAIKERAKKLNLKSVDDLPSEERTNIINQVMRGRNPLLTEFKPGFAKARAIAQIDDSIIDQYQDPKTALNSYIMKSVNDIHKRKFFGRGGKVKDTSIRQMNLNESIGSYIDDAQKRGDLAEADESRLAELLEARFGLGEMGAGEVSSVMRNIGYMTTLGNPFSALTQIGDLGMSVYLNGLKNTISSVLGKKSIDLKDLGINNVVAQELSTVGKTAKFLDKTLGAVGFKAIDRLGKNTLLNSSYRKLSSMAKNEKGIASIRKKYGKMLDEEFKSTIDDLKAGNITDNVKLVLYNELAGVQPINLSQMPLNYLRNPNGRIFYSLKTFAIKQLDVMRRDIAQEFKAGNTKKATENLVAYMTIIPMMGATVDEAKDMLKGQGTEINDIPDNYIENLFKVFGGSQYVMDKYVNKGQVGSAIGETIAPPLDWINALSEDIWKIMNGEFEGSESKAMRELPIIGKVWYNFFGGGLENAIKYEEERRKD